MTERIEEFTIDGKNFMYVDVSDIKQNSGFIDVVERVKPLIRQYPEKSLHMILNIANIRFDSETKEIAVAGLTHNRPYVKYGTIIGVDGIKKIMFNVVLKITGRDMPIFFSKEQAIAWLLKQD